MTGTQGAGAPDFDITSGFVGELHIENGIILTSGMLSIIFAKGNFVVHLFMGKTDSDDGEAPKEQLRTAVELTKSLISHLLAQI